ncbi:beta strand repeat-containing protein, partial [Azospirillum argentinense]|uniref:beta strand repeat-containing protein n=1 Tax=Azospirillum argentinense TaxID=2970906 RepID=UPI0032E010C2
MTSVALMASAIVPVAAQSLPSGPSVAAGAVSIATPSGTSVIIDQSSRNAVINWNSFSIGKGNSVAINNGGGATLNRVTGNIPSRIDGSLTATGSVYLVNPAGVAVGPTGKVLTGGSFTASTLDVSDAAFLKGGDKTFSGTSKATVTNAGSIGSLGGDVALIAREVGNSGTITAPNGTVGLAAGYEVLVKDGAVEGGKFHVKVGGADTAAATSGRITAAAAEIRANGGNVYALAGNTGGVIAATGTASVGGRVFLTAGDSGTVEAGGSITATRTAENGAVQGGDIRVSGGKTTVSGALSAKGAVGKGGTAGKGGTVAVTGAAVTLTGTASLDASGGRGGAVVVGGDYQGGKDAARKTLKETVANAKTTTVAAGARLSADGTAGDGGSVVVWSDERTDFAGTIAARGAGTGGNGGSAEVSGKALLSFTGTADLRAASGKTGTLLLDPYNLTISAAADGNVSGLSANGDDSVLSVATLTAALASANVTVTTGSGGSQAGTITVAAPVAWSADTVLTLAADGDIVVNAPITATGSAAGLVLQYGAGKGYSFGSAGSVTLSGANATLRIGETGALQSYTLIHDMAALDDIETTGPSGLYALAQSLDAAGTTYTAAVVAGTFTGTFTGLGNSIANLTINAPDTDDVGLFGTLGSGSSLRDIGLVNATVIGKSRVGGLAGATLGTVAQAYVAGGSVTGSEWVGGLIGANDHGVIGQSYATGNVTGSGSYVGGLVGGSSNATYETVHATGAVVGSESVGGLIGDSDSDSITKAFATGSVSGASTVGGLIGALRGGAGSLSESYATGDVTATVNKAGGLLGGAEDASVSKVYATGSVTGTISDDDGEHFIGGLVGDSFYASISDAYATGRVTLSAACTSSNCKAGGLAGRQANGTIRDSYWDKGTTGQAGDIGDGSGSNTVGIETDDAFSAASYASFNFANAWYMVEGQTRPFLRSEQSTTIFNAHQLQLMQLDLSAAYTLAADIDAGETGGSNASGMWRIGGSRHGFLPVGDGSAAFTGSLDGQGHVIRGLTIAPADYSANHGLFGVVGAAGSIRDLGLLDVSITGNGITVGGLVGENNGTITNAHVTGSVQGLSVGGLVGRNTGTIAQSYSTASVEAPALGGDEIGGLVSENTGTITQSYATGNVTGRSTVGGFVAKNSGAISQSYATGAVTATIGTDTGGFAGLNSGSISQSYATGGAVSGNMSVGGLVGMNSGSIDQSYTTKAVSGSSLVGGFAGYYVGGTITSSYFDTTTSGTTEHAGSQSTLVGVTGLTTALFQDTASFMAGATGWDFDTVWAPPSGGYYPVLYSLVPVTWVKAVSATSVYGSSSGTISAVGAHSVPGAYVFGKAGDSLSLVGGTITVDATTGVSATPTITSLTTANVMVTSAKGAAYRVFYYGDVAQTVTPAALTITADAASKTYGDTATLTGFTTSGLKNSDGVTGVTLTSAGTAATAGVGGYAITAASATGTGLSNYTITYADGTLTVDPAALSITADAASKTYGDTATLTGYTTSGLKNSDGVTSVSLSSAGTVAAAGVGGYAITAASATGTGLSNYTITYAGGTLTVDPAALTITADAASKTYGDTATLTGFTTSGLKNDDGVTGVTLTSAGTAA